MGFRGLLVQLEVPELLPGHSINSLSFMRRLEEITKKKQKLNHRTYIG
jgi:hypothetical protein